MEMYLSWTIIVLGAALVIGAVEKWRKLTLWIAFLLALLAVYHAHGWPAARFLVPGEDFTVYACPLNMMVASPAFEPENIRLYNIECNDETKKQIELGGAVLMDGHEFRLGRWDPTPLAVYGGK